MSLYTARLLVSMTRRLDRKQDQLGWIPDWMYTDFRGPFRRR